MIQPLSHRLLQNGKYFLILKFIILQQNISSVWIFGDQFAWHQHGQEMDTILQHLVGTLPKYVSDLNATKTMCMDNENIKHLNIFFVVQSFGWNELNFTCATDYTMVLFQDRSTKIVLPQKRTSDNLQRIVFGTIHGLDFSDISDGQGYLSLPIRYAEPMKDLFIEKSLNLNAKDYRIFYQLQPPNSLLTLHENKFFFFGPNAQLANEVTKMLNATSVIQTDLGFEYPNESYYNLFKDAKYLRSKKFLKVRERMIPLLPQNTITDFYANCSDYVDICILAQLIKGKGIELTEFLYPYEMKCLRIVVPRIQTTHRFVEKLYNNSVVQCISLVVLVLFISKIILNRSLRVYDWTETLFLIVATLLAQKQPKVSAKLWETIWNVQVIAMVIFSTAALSAISYQTLVSVKYVPQIETLNDLIDSNLSIYVEKSKREILDTSAGNLDPKLLSKIVYQDQMIISVRNNKQNIAYIWEEDMAEFHVVISKNLAPNGELPGMRLARQPIYCGFSSIRLINGSPFKHPINTIYLRMFESGISRQQEDTAVQFLMLSNRKISGDRNFSQKMRPLTLFQIGDIFFLLIGGVALGCVVFTLEIIWNWFTLRKCKILQRRRAQRCAKRKVLIFLSKKDKQ